jgi:hypothetical protein
MENTKAFDGLYTNGMNTGNNTGIFPDKVMIDSYGLFSGNSASLKITGLDLTMKYDFTFFASSQAYGDINVAYTINDKRSLLNASLNKNGTVTMYDITPNKSGEVTISIVAGTPTSQFGLIGALIIQGHAPSINSIPPPPGFSAIVSNGTENKLSPEKKKNEIQIKAYPNPFNNEIILSVPVQRSYEEILITIYNEQGRLVYENKFNDLVQGNNIIKIQSNKNLSAPGIYLLKAAYLKAGTFKFLKLIKE